MNRSTRLTIITLLLVLGLPQLRGLSPQAAQADSSPSALTPAITALNAGAPGTLNTVVGGGVADGSNATVSNLNYPSGMAISGTNVIIADSQNNRIRMFSPNGTIVTLAGSPYSVPGGAGDGGPAVNATLFNPGDVAVDSMGNIYIADSGNHKIRKINTAGIISTVAGTGVAGYNGDNILASKAQLNDPRGVAVDAAGNLYIADSYNYRIREVSKSTGIITTIAGTGVQSSGGTSGDGGPATAAAIHLSFGVTVDKYGNVFIADTQNARIREVIKATGIMTGVAGIGCASLDQGKGCIGGFSGDGGPATAAQFSQPYRVTIDGAGNLYVADGLNYRIREVISATHMITTVVGNGINADAGDGGLPAKASIEYAFDSAFDKSGNFYVLGSTHLREVLASTHLIATVAGNGSCCYSGNGLQATQAALQLPAQAIVGPNSNLVIADANNNVIRAVSPSGVITTIVGTGVYSETGDGGPATAATLKQPTSIAFDSQGNLYIADRAGFRVREVFSATGIITTVAGTGVSGYAGDGGLATKATFKNPTGVYVDPQDNLFIVDRGNNVIREVIHSTGIITTVAGNGTAGYTGDGGSPTQAALNGPFAMTEDPAGNMYIADQGNSVVREVISATHVITTFAGTGVLGNTGDGGPATQATFKSPIGVSFDQNGNLYIADQTSQVIRQVSPLGIIHTVAGNGLPGYSGEGVAAVSSRLNKPVNMSVGPDGTLYIVDQNNNLIRAVTPGPAQTATASPVAATVGSTVLITATSFNPGEIVAVNLDSATGPLLGTGLANSSGTALVSVMIPKTTAGIHLLIASGRTSLLSAQGVVFVQPSITVIPSTGTLNQTVVITGSGYGANEPVNGYWNNYINLAAAANAGSIVGLSSGVGGSWSVTNINDNNPNTGWASGYQQVTNQYIQFSFSSAQPVTIDQVLLDPAATGGDPAAMDVKDFQVRVSTTDLQQSSFTTVFTGTAQQANSAQYFTFAPVQAKYVELFMVDNYGDPSFMEAAEFGAFGNTVTFGAQTDSKGSFSTSMNIPNGAIGTHILTVRGETSMLMASTNVIVPGPTLIANPNSAAAGATVNVAATSMGANDTANLYWNGYSDQVAASAGGTIVGGTSNAGGGWDIHNINDGNSTTGWASGYQQVTNQYIQFAFPNNVTSTLDSIVFDPAATGGDPAAMDVKDFQVRVSTTDLQQSSFTTVFTGTAQQANSAQYFTFAPVQAKYVELFMVDNYGDPSFMEAAEFQAYGGGLLLAAVPTDPTGSFSTNVVIPTDTSGQHTLAAHTVTNDLVMTSTFTITP